MTPKKLADAAASVIADHDACYPVLYDHAIEWYRDGVFTGRIACSTFAGTDALYQEIIRQMGVEVMPDPVTQLFADFIAALNEATSERDKTLIVLAANLRLPVGYRVPVPSDYAHSVPLQFARWKKRKLL